MSVTRRSARNATVTPAFPVLDNEMIRQTARAYETWLQCCLTVNAEMGMFLTKRLQRDAQLPLSIAECHNPQEVMQTQVDFWKTMAEDYSHQTHRVGEIVSQGLHAFERPQHLSWPQFEDHSTVEHKAAA